MPADHVVRQLQFTGDVEGRRRLAVLEATDAAGIQAVQPLMSRRLQCMEDILAAIRLGTGFAPAYSYLFREIQVCVCSCRWRLSGLVLYRRACTTRG